VADEPVKVKEKLQEEEGITHAQGSHGTENVS
jgi:hypothetical protein